MNDQNDEGSVSLPPKSQQFVPPIPASRPSIRRPAGLPPLAAPTPQTPLKPPSWTPEALAAKQAREQQYQNALKAQARAKQRLYRARSEARKKGLPLPPLHTPSTEPFKLPDPSEDLGPETEYPTRQDSSL